MLCWLCFLDEVLHTNLNFNWHHRYERYLHTKWHTYVDNLLKHNNNKLKRTQNMLHFNYWLLMNMATTQIKIQKTIFLLNLILSLLYNNKLEFLKLSIWTCLICNSCSKSLILFTNLGRIKLDLGSTYSLSLHQKNLQFLDWKWSK